MTTSMTTSVTTSVNLKSQRRAIGFGLFLITLGIVANHWLLTALFSRDGTIAMTHKLVIWSFQLVSGATGAWLIHARAKLQIRTGAIANVALVAFSLLLTAAAAELMLRFVGFTPYRIIESNVAAKSGENYFTENPTLGFSLLPGEFTLLLGEDYSFHATHLANGLRVTHPLATYPADPAKEEIWIFGDSVTYGWSLNDEEVYAWQLQEAFPEYEFVNFSVPGYGPVHGLIQLEEALATGKRPKLIILNYASYQDQRNVSLRQHQKFLVGSWNRLRLQSHPYARINANNELSYGIGPLTYREFPLMRQSALINLIEMGYNRLQEQIYRSNDVSKAIIDRMYRIAYAEGIDFILAGIWPDELTIGVLEDARVKGISVVDISVDPDIPENRNLPYDDHPSAYAHRQYTERMVQFLNEVYFAK